MNIKAKEIALLITLWGLSSLFIIGILFSTGVIEFTDEPELEPEVIKIQLNWPKEEVVIEEVEEEQIIEEVIVEEVVEEPVVHITDAEYLAKMMNAEAGNQDEVGQRLIADVILNRVDSIYFPDTIEAVIFAPGQFVKPASTYTDRQLEMAIEEMERRIDSDIIAFRTGCFHSNEKWMDAYVHGAHYFSKFKPEYCE